MSQSYGYSRGSRVLDLKTQGDSLKVLAELTQRATVDPLVRGTAIKIVREAGSRDDDGELQAIYDAVKNGDPEIPALKRGFKYIADPRFADYFTSPVDSLKACAKGACAGDCDDHAALIGALAGSLGWKVGLRAWGPQGGPGFTHVYCVVAYPKRAPFESSVGMDTTVPNAKVGWEPPRGDVLTAWLE